MSDIKQGVSRCTLAGLVLALVMLWSLTHRFQGLGGDAGLYAVQALSRLHPNLRSDLFLRFTSQDNYTLFSDFYAGFIRWMGLQPAALVLTVLSKFGFFTAAWALARRFMGRFEAGAAIATLIVIAGTYGGYSVFHYAEDWVTARSFAEAAIVSALGLEFAGYHRTGLAVALCAVFIHPLMALPGVLCLVMLWLPIRVGAALALIGVASTSGIAVSAVAFHINSRFLGVMDATWLEVVMERSQFLFLQLWRLKDWEQNLRPLLSLALTALAVPDARVRRLSICSIEVAVAGVLIAWIASRVGPVNILLQGQAWRWTWIAAFCAILLLVPTVLALSRTTRGGLLCAVLVIAAWTFSPFNGSLCLALSLALWVAHPRVDERWSGALRLAALLFAAGVISWEARTLWLSIPTHQAAISDRLVATMHSLFAIKILALGFAFVIIQRMTKLKSLRACFLLNGALLAGVTLALPYSLEFRSRDGTVEALQTFAGWRSVIAPDETVFVAPAHNSPAFAWFTLQRPSYLTVDQSSGVVFSRPTALEVRRRSEDLRRIMKPDWKLMSNLGSPESSRTGSDSLAITLDDLIGICSDPSLGFIVTKGPAITEPLRRIERGPWKDWNLYGCQKILENSHPQGSA